MAESNYLLMVKKYNHAYCIVMFLIILVVLYLFQEVFFDSKPRFYRNDLNNV